MVDTKCFDHQQLDVETTLACARRLYKDRNFRDTSRLFFIEGVRNFVRVIDNRFELETILYSEKLLAAPLARKLVRQSRRDGVPTLNLTPEQFRQIAYNERASGVAAIVRQRWAKLSQISPQTGLCWVALETVRSAGNLGTLMRTSSAVGGAGLILVGNQIDPFDPDVIRSSMSGIFSQQFVRTNLTQLRDWLHQHQCQTIGASPDGNIDLYQFDYPPATVLFLGEERQGLTPQQRDLCRHLVRIPMVGDADSLNLGVAGSLFLYEVYRRDSSRQRG
ncbi:TrmH family RNA methyltransferase [Chamaesiphon polymorphus]|uniref:RNA methyltransferase n=1 Tax=Chamaesiphon polymorphus CCALA 037 TaxID=2107692 RepID=A0A2T1GD38_9CYAN|nr:RNA methyltransferase [Chamaesiphon polymorphus]PSB55259.1 RNA methyltransferase [Chamaesiphon polymorphus CCALA 037]